MKHRLFIHKVLQSCNYCYQSDVYFRSDFIFFLFICLQRIRRSDLSSNTPLQLSNALIAMSLDLIASEAPSQRILRSFDIFVRLYTCILCACVFICIHAYCVPVYSYVYMHTVCLCIHMYTCILCACVFICIRYVYCVLVYSYVYSTCILCACVFICIHAFCVPVYSYVYTKMGSNVITIT